MSYFPSQFDRSWLGQMLAPLTEAVSVLTMRDRLRMAPRDGVEADFETASRRRRERHRQH